MKEYNASDLQHNSYLPRSVPELAIITLTRQ